MQRIFKYGDRWDISLTPDKELNILVYWSPSHVVIYRLCPFKNGPLFWPTLYTVVPLSAFTATQITVSRPVVGSARVCHSFQLHLTCTSFMWSGHSTARSLLHLISIFQCFNFQSDKFQFSKFQSVNFQSCKFQSPSEACCWTKSVIGVTACQFLWINNENSNDASTTDAGQRRWIAWYEGSCRSLLMMGSQWWTWMSWSNVWLNHIHQSSTVSLITREIVNNACVKTISTWHS